MNMLIKIKNKIETIPQYIKDFVDARSAHFGLEGQRFCNIIRQSYNLLGVLVSAI